MNLHLVGTSRGPAYSGANGRHGTNPGEVTGMGGFGGARTWDLRWGLPRTATGVVTSRVNVDRTGNDEVERVCREFLAALVEADGGEMYLVSVSPDDVHIHLAGTCSGCPGATFTGDQMMTPVILGVAPKAKVRVTTGWLVPEGAKRVEPKKTR